MTQPFVSPLDLPKPAGEVDMIIAVGDIMINHGMMTQVEQHYITDINIRLGRGKIADVQLRILRQYFGDQFLALQKSTGFDGSVDTLDIRQHVLVPTDPHMWLTHFKEHVVPFLIHYNLPGPGLS